MKTSFRKTPAYGWIALAVAFMLLAGTDTAGAQTMEKTNQRNEFNQAVYNPCNGRLIPMQGFTHIVSNTRVSGDSIHYNMKNQTNASGTDVMTIQYNFGSQMQASGKFPPGPVTFRDRQRVVSSGPTDNFFATVAYHFDGNGRPQKTTVESDCRGSGTLGGL